MNTQPNVFTPASWPGTPQPHHQAATFEALRRTHSVTDDLIEFHRLPAEGGVGMTTVAYLAVTPGGRTQGKQIWWRREAIPGLRQLIDAIHAEGAAISAQIAHAGPVADARSNDAEALAPMTSKYAKAASRDDIADVVAAHATAARLAIEAGFDAVEVHLGHNYFASAFLSPLINQRDDEFGGSLENRAKVRAAAEAVRRAVDDTGAGRIAVTAKLNMADGVDGGITVEESPDCRNGLQDDGLSGTRSNSLREVRGKPDVPRSEAARRARMFPPSPRSSANTLLRRMLFVGMLPPFTCRADDSADPSRRYHQPADHGSGDGRGIRLHRDGTSPARRTRSVEPHQSRRRRAHRDVGLYAHQ
jgi:2,4-dienoyl-CoA reductase-like NADH-dependent reductase (Old Yellow Enzyme family)